MRFSLFSTASLNGGELAAPKPVADLTCLPEITASNIKELAGTLESQGELFWDYKISFKLNIIRLLKAYSETWSFTRHHRSDLRTLTSLVEKESADDSIAAIKRLTELTYAQIFGKGGKVEGEALRTLRYILIHCSGLYTPEIREQLIHDHLVASSGEAARSYEHFAVLH